MKNHKIKLQLFLKNLPKSRFVFRSFFMLVGFISILFLIFIIYTYRKSRQIIEEEFKSSSRYSTEVIANSVDDYLMEVRYIAATLDTNKIIKTYFYSDNPENVITSINSRIQDYLKVYDNSSDSIDSIYLYSEKSNAIITANEKISAQYFTDINWKDHFSDNFNVYTIFPRVKNNSYPFILSLMKQIQVNNYNAAIVININLSNLPNLAEVKNNNYQEVYLITNENEILYKNNQQELLESISNVPELIHFNSDLLNNSILVSNRDDPYTYTQIKSSNYDWSYVVVTHLQEYTYRLSDNRAVLLSFCIILFFTAIAVALLFSLHFFKPIRDIIQLFDKPERIITLQKKTDKEIKYIADQITTYILTNKTLSDELNARLNLLNETKLFALQSQINPHFLFNSLNMIHILEIDALGYDHFIPKISLSLSKLLRYAIESTDLVSLETELDYTKLYISILNQRYGNKLQTQYSVDSEVLNAKVPKLFIQPIIENAVFHGLAKNINDKSKLIISCKKSEDICIVTITDNGTGMTPEVLQSLRDLIKEETTPEGNIGLKNIAIRMTLLYRNKFCMTIDSIENEGSTFTLHFPYL